MSWVFQNIDPQPPSPPRECVPPAFRPLAGWRGGGGGGGGGGGSIFWKTQDTAVLYLYRILFDVQYLKPKVSVSVAVKS
jgi:hypothetical protein